jgi:hypothetical protein
MGRLKTILSLAILGGLVYLAATRLDLRLLARLFASLSALEVLGLALLPVGLMLAKATRFTVLFAPSTRRGQLTAVYGYVASQAVSSFPTGIAGRAAVLKSSGLPFGKNMFPLIADSFFDLSYLALATLTVAALDPTYRAPVYLAMPVAICLAPLALARPIRKLVKRASFAAAVRMGKRATWRELHRSFARLRVARGLWACAGLTLLANLLNLFNLWCAVRAFELTVPLGALLVSLTVPSLVGRIVFLPGSGTGLVAAGMAAILAGSGGLTANQGTAIAIVYRIIDMALPSIYGALVLLLVRSPGRSTEATAAQSRALSDLGRGVAETGLAKGREAASSGRPRTSTLPHAG